jgi:hypothetical protein
MDQERSSPIAPAGARNRFDRMEWAGAFGDLGTLIPFVVAYITLLKVDPYGILLAFGVAMIVTGFIHRTPFPVQPMKEREFRRYQFMTISMREISRCASISSQLMVSARA